MEKRPNGREAFCALATKRGKMERGKGRSKLKGAALT